MTGAPPELTMRALIIGALLGGVLAVVNTYVGLKIGITESGHFFVVLVGYAICAGVARGASASPLELNAIQTIATAAAGMVNVVGISGGVGGLVMLGYTPSTVLVAALGVATAAFGLLIAGLLRSPLLVHRPLPFPTGQATAKLIATISSDHGAAHQVRPLVVGASLSASLAWLRDGRPAIVPATLWLPSPYREAAATGFGLAVSPLLAAVGVLIGTSTAMWIAVGSGLAWLAIGPWLVASERAAATYTDLSAWLVWPGIVLVLTGSLTTLVRRWIAPRWHAPARRVVAAVLAVAAVITGVGSMLGAPIAAMVVGLALAPALAWVGARVAAESDVSLNGSLGALSQVAIAPLASMPVAILVPATVTSGVVAQTVTSLWALKAGALLGASRRQWLGLALGSAIGAVISPAMFAILIRTHELGGAGLPAPVAATFAASSRALLGGASALGSGGAAAALIAAIAGIVLALASGPGWRRYIPSPTALGIGFLLPVAYAVPIALGGVASAVAARLRAGAAARATPVAIGTIVGEALIGTLVAGLRITGIL